MVQITFINKNGESIVVKESYPFLLQDFDPGYTPISLMINSHFNQDGQSYYGSILDPRGINFSIVIKGTSEVDLLSLCDEMYSVFNPKLGLGTLVYDNGIVKRQIYATVSLSPQKVEILDNRNRRKFNIGLYCPRPAWESYERNALKMVGFVGGCRFPMTFPNLFAVQGDQLEIQYNGSLDAPLLIEFRGPATKPKILKKETGEFIEINVEILTNEKLYIDTKPNEINVYKDDGAGNIISAFNYIDPFTSYFQITKGLNTLSFNASLGDPEVYLFYREQYMGA